MALLPPGTVGGGTTSHNDLVGRELANSHPVGAVTGLSDWMIAKDAAIAAGTNLRSIYNFNNVNMIEILMPLPLDSLSVALVMVRTSDGAVIEPDIQYVYATGVRYVERLRLRFSPPASGEHFIHVIR